MLKRLMMILAAATLAGGVTVTGAQAQRGGGHGGGLGGGSGNVMNGFARGTGSGIGRGARFRQIPALQNRIPAPLPPPPQPPVINGPLSPSGLPSMGGAR